MWGTWWGDRRGHFWAGGGQAKGVLDPGGRRGSIRGCSISCLPSQALGPCMGIFSSMVYESGQWVYECGAARAPHRVKEQVPLP